VWLPVLCDCEPAAIIAEQPAKKPQPLRWMLSVIHSPVELDAAAAAGGRSKADRPSNAVGPCP